MEEGSRVGSWVCMAVPAVLSARAKESWWSEETLHREVREGTVCTDVHQQEWRSESQGSLSGSGDGRPAEASGLE